MGGGTLRRVVAGAAMLAALLVAFSLGLAATFSQALAVMVPAGFLGGWLLRAWRELWVVPAAVAIVFAALVAWQRLVVEPRSALRPVEMWWQLQWAFQVALFTPPALLGAAGALLVARRVLRPR